MMIVKKAAKDAGKKLGVRFPDSAIEGLNKMVMDTVQKAAERAKQNGRVTLREYDF